MSTPENRTAAPAGSTHSAPKIVVEDLHKHFGENEVLKGIDTRIAEGEVVCVIGPSGSGKSTFLRCLNRLEDLPSASARDDGPTGPETAVAGHPLSG